MPTLTPLDSRYGFSAGDVNTDGYIAAIPAFQAIYFADGRDYDNKGYHKLVFHTTKIAGAVTVSALTKGELVTQANNPDAKGIYDECIDVKLTGTFTGLFQVGEKVTQATTLAIGYVVYVGNGFINVAPVSRDTDTGLRINFATTSTVTGETSGATMPPSAVSTIGVGLFHYIYRTTTTEFDNTNIITGATSGGIITPVTVAAVQTLTPNITATSGTFTLTYDGQTTAAIAYNASTATIQTALEALSTVETGDITVGGQIFSAGTGGLTLTFADTLGSVPAVTIVESMGGTTAVTVAKTITGTKAVTAPPHWMNWIPDGPGIMPDGGSNIGCLCFGRIFLNSMFNPHQWFCSRTFSPMDWDSAQTDVGAATSSQNSKAGEVGNPIIAMIPYKDNYLIWGCANEMWVLRGDPLQGGINTCLSKTTGIFSPTSYCWDDKNNLYFIGSDGIYKFTARAILNGMPPVNITKEHIPKLVTDLGLNRRTDRVTMAYDKQRYGVEVSVTQMDGAWSVCFWIDLRTGGLFPDKFPTDQSPASLYYYDSYKTSERGLLMGGYDGYIRKFDETAKEDEGSNAIDSFACIGPFVDEKETRNKVTTNETSLTLAEDTDGITFEIYSADSADELITNVLAGSTPVATKTLTGDGLKSSVRDKVTGRAVAMKFGNNTASQSWSIESINVNIKSKGKQK